MFLIAVYILSLIIFAVAIVFAWRTVSRLRNTSATYNARLLPFAYFSLTSWILGALQCAILVTSSLISFPGEFRLATGLWLAFMQNVLWAAAVLSLYSKQFSRISQTLPIFVAFPTVVALAFPTYRVGVLTSETFTYIDAVLTFTIFVVFAVSLLQWHLSKVFAAAFLAHGYSQSIWTSLWFTPWPETQRAILLAFPLWRIALLVIWIRLISAMLGRAQRSYQEVVNDIRRLALPTPLKTIKVMISSTVSDLAQERDAAESAIRALGLTTFRVEQLGSLSLSPREICQLMAEECDIFILIIGERYGHIIESEGISVVECEYEVARAQNPGKILVYVKDGVNREPRLEALLKRLQDFEHGHFTSLFTPEDLYEKIQRDIARWLTSNVKQKQP
jgi:hypothetical protein